MNDVVPILLYHSISDSPSDESAPFTVTPADFERHMDLLQERSFHTMTVSDYVTARASGTLPNDRRVALVTFDDGYRDFAETALSALLARKIASTMYITTGWMSDTPAREAGPSDSMMSFAQLPDLVAAGVEIGAHSHAHHQMDTLSDAHSHDELRRSKELLEDAIGAAVASFAYPHGYNSSRIRKQAREVGYSSATAVRNALSPADDNVYRLARLMLMRDTTVGDVAAWLDGEHTPIASKHESPQTIGWRVYRRTRALLSGQPGSAYR